MPIPPLNSQGLLPAGIHSCTIDEIEEIFGRFHLSDVRPRIFETFQSFVAELRASGLAIALIVDSSFVTSEPAPNDIDGFIIVRKNFSSADMLPPADYNTISSRNIRKRYRFDMLLARQDGIEEQAYIEFFQQVRRHPDLRKGILRIDL